jgi:hypothetical protein
MLHKLFSRKPFSGVQNSGTAVQTTDGNTTRRMLFAYWLKLQISTQNKLQLLFSMATVIKRTPLTVIFIVNCLTFFGDYIFTLNSNILATICVREIVLFVPDCCVYYKMSWSGSGSIKRWPRNTTQYTLGHTPHGRCPFQYLFPIYRFERKTAESVFNEQPEGRPGRHPDVVLRISDTYRVTSYRYRRVQIVMRRSTMVIRSEKCVDWRFRRCAKVIVYLHKHR